MAYTTFDTKPADIRISGIASGSLHGWVWLVMAYGGSLAGIAARPLFGLDGFKKS